MLKRRVEKIEGRGKGDHQKVANIITGRDAAGTMDRAWRDGHVYHRAEGETEAAFLDRVAGDAEVRVVLPDNGRDPSLWD